MGIIGISHKYLGKHNSVLKKIAGHNFGMVLHKGIIEGHTRITTILSLNLGLFNNSEVIIVVLA